MHQVSNTCPSRQEIMHTAITKTAVHCRSSLTSHEQAMRLNSMVSVRYMYQHAMHKSAAYIARFVITNPNLNQSMKVLSHRYCIYNQRYFKVSLQHCILSMNDWQHHAYWKTFQKFWAIWSPNISRFNFVQTIIIFVLSRNYTPASKLTIAPEMLFAYCSNHGNYPQLSETSV